MVRDKYTKNGCSIRICVMGLVLIGLFLQAGCSYLQTAKKVPMPPKMWWENAMTAKPMTDPETGDKKLVRTSTFFSEDAAVTSTITLRNVSGEHDLRWEWVRPDGKHYYVSGKQPVHTKKGMFVSELVVSHKILVNGDKAEKILGDWWVNIYLDGEKITTQNFTIKGDAKIQGAWFILDDYLDKNAYTSTERFAEFKSSDYLANLIAEKAGKQKFRFDLIRGAYTEKVPNDYSVRAKSSFTRISEIKALVNLAEHDPDVADIKWNLHLFLARKTSGNLEEAAINEIVERLRQLNVDKITVWEFCNHQPAEKTVYQSIFEQFIEKIELRCEVIYHPDMFDDIYRKIYYE